MKTGLSSLSLVKGFWGLLALTLFAHLPLLTPASSTAQSASNADLERAAMREGRLRIVVFPAFAPLAEAFEKKHGIKIEGSYVGEPDIVRRVSTESEAGIFQTDLFSASPGPGGSHLNKWAMPYQPKGFEKIGHVKAALPADWHWNPLVTQVVGVIYNKDLVPPHQVPKSIYDLLKAEFKGRIISRTPWLGSNYIVHILSYFTWFNRDMAKWRDYWTLFRGNVGRYEAGWPSLHFAVGLKEYPLGTFTVNYMATQFGGTYPGLAYSTFKEGGIWWPTLAAIHKNAPHPNAAKLFVNFLVNDEGQRLFADGGNLPANRDVPPKPEIKKAVEGVKLLNGDLQSILIRETTEKDAEWKARIQKIYQ